LEEFGTLHYTGSPPPQPSTATSRLRASVLLGNCKIAIKKARLREEAGQDPCARAGRRQGWQL